VEEQRALATVGRTLFQSAVSPSELRQAQSAFLESLSICDQLRDIVKEKELLEMRARLYLNLGLVFTNLKNPKKGVRYIEKALAITVNHSLKETEYRCHFSRGEIKLAEKHPAEALQCFERARKAAQHQGMKFEEADTLVQMGQILLQLGDFKGAKNILKKCFKTMKHGNMIDELRSSLIKAIKGTRLLEKLQNSRGTKDEILMKTCEDLGDLYSSVKCYSKAIHYYLKQLELSQILDKSNQEKAVNCFSIAQSYSDNTQYNKAKEYFHKELLLLEGKPQEQCDTWCRIAEVSELASDCFEEIEKAYNNALECARKCENANRKLRLLKLLSELRRKQKNDEDDDECKI
jgi:NF-kappa-B inhibitor-like protein 2